MKRQEIRHYSEEELLLHILGDENADLGITISSHLEKCHECKAILQEYQELLKDIHCWRVEEFSEAAWQAQKERLLTFVRQDGMESRGNAWAFLAGAVSQAWDYALAHPLPTLGYIAVAVAFVSERTISVFRLDQILPATGEVIQILRQVL
jgi:hypothetical protein